MIWGGCRGPFYRPDKLPFNEKYYRIYTFNYRICTFFGSSFTRFYIYNLPILAAIKHSISFPDPKNDFSLIFYIPHYQLSNWSDHQIIKLSNGRIDSQH
jgi:hypothetical protein